MEIRKEYLTRGQAAEYCLRKGLPVRPRDRLNRLQFKLEQMVARYKQCQEDLETEYQKNKSTNQE